MDKLVNESSTTKEKFIEFNKLFSSCNDLDKGINTLLQEEFLCNIFKTFIGNSFYIKHKTSISLLEKLVITLYKENKKDLILLDSILDNKSPMGIKVLIVLRLILNITYTGEKDKITKDIILKTLNNAIDEIILTLQ